MSSYPIRVEGKFRSSKYPILPSVRPSHDKNSRGRASEDEGTTRRIALFAFTDPETRFFLPLLFPFLSLYLTHTHTSSLFCLSPLHRSHDRVYIRARASFAEASLVKVTASSGGESESHFRDKRWPPTDEIISRRRTDINGQPITRDTCPSVSDSHEPRNR